MILDTGKMTEFLSLPAGEAEAIIEAIKQAEQTNDIEALKWCARRIIWLADVSEIESGDDEHYPARFFNMAWNETLKNDPTPESIIGIIAKINQREGATA